ALRSEASASRISGCGSGVAAGAALGWAVAAVTGAAAGAFGDAGVVTDKQSASARVATAERLTIFIFIVRSMTFKIFAQAPESHGNYFILASDRWCEMARKRVLIANVTNV